MKIGIIGPPQVGKTQFAEELANEFDLSVVDDYISTDLALGMWASYSENLMVAGLRLAAEERHKDDRITVGTLVDTICYAAVKTDVITHNSLTHRDAAYKAAQGAMSGLGVMLAETWDYDISFYLPYSDVEKEKAERWAAVLDTGYVSVIESFGINWVYTLQGTHQERVDIAKDVIKVAQKSDTSETTEVPETPATK